MAWIFGIIVIGLLGGLGVQRKEYLKLRHLWKSADGNQRRLDEKFRRKQKALRELEERHARTEKDRRRLGIERDKALDELHEAQKLLHEVNPHLYPEVPTIGAWVKKRYGPRAKTI